MFQILDQRIYQNRGDIRGSSQAWACFRFLALICAGAWTCVALDAQPVQRRAEIRRRVGEGAVEVEQDRARAVTRRRLRHPARSEGGS